MSDAPSPRGLTALLTAATMCAFAANSLLCRAALQRAERPIDPVAFTTVRMLAGALLLALVAPLLEPLAGQPTDGSLRPASGDSWRGAAALYAYAIAFSLAYVTLTASVGALVLFGAVQATMLAAALRAGERPGPAQWAGLAVALAGLVVLLFPGLSAPDPLGAALMALAGVAWGVYSLLGRGASRPVAATRGNFLRAAPLALGVGLGAFLWRGAQADRYGLLLAAASGALASGLGYSVWYRALRGHTATTAAVVQLSVPLLAALGGTLLLGEAPSARLGIAGAMILGGVALAVLSKATGSGR